jgi:ferredoxin-NADP reductase
VGPHLLILGAVLVCRLCLPAWRTLFHRLRVAAVVIEAPGVVSVYVTGHNFHRLPARAGQFFNWRFLDWPGWSRAHPYSLSAAPHLNWIHHEVYLCGPAPRVEALRASLTCAGVPAQHLHTERFAW